LVVADWGNDDADLFQDDEKIPELNGASNEKSINIIYHSWILQLVMFDYQSVNGVLNIAILFDK
jgi:hypothetical protein